jgi:hypothetical protein
LAGPPRAVALVHRDAAPSIGEPESPRCLALFVGCACDNAGVSGWGNLSGIAYQQAHAVLACLEMLDAEDGRVVSVKVESAQDVFDLELCDSAGGIVASRQIKNRVLDRTWTPSDVFPLIRRWATSEHPAGARFELRLGGRAGPSTETSSCLASDACRTTAGRRCGLREAGQNSWIMTIIHHSYEMR